MRVQAPRLRHSTPAPELDAITAFVRRHAERATGERRLLALRFPAPVAPPATLVRTLRKAPGHHWTTPGGLPTVSHGATVQLRAPSQGSLAARCADLRERSDALFEALVEVHHPEVPPAPTRLFGGFAFDPSAEPDALWRDFGAGTFVLPRWSYQHEADGRASLALTLDARDGWSGRVEVLLAELRTVWGLLEGPPLEPPDRLTAAPRSVVHGDRDAYRRRIEEITAAIGRGEVEKVVFSRRVHLRSDRDVEPWRVLDALAATYPQTWRFGIRLGSSTFLGATPERLFVKRGRTVETDALAGSVALGPDAAARLLASGKDRREHAFVVRHLEHRLGPLCTHLEVPGEPSVRRLPNVIHLHTPLRGTLREEVHALDLVRSLHPTPAVGGTPVESARRWIRAHEESPRGWYTGALGWLDAAGDAELVVALRCGLFRGAAATLFAGGGIVQGSNPDGEWDESALKLQPLLQALAAPPG